MTRVLLLPADEAGCGLYRMRLPGVAAGAHGLDVAIGDGVDIITDGDTVRSVLAPDADVVVIQRPLDWRWAQAIPILQANGVGVVVDVDDRFDAIHPANPAHLVTHPRLSPAKNFQHLAAACRAADVVTVSTPALADLYGKHGRCVVLENCVPAATLQRPVSPQDGFGWAGAAVFHPDDLRVVGAAVARVVRSGWPFRVVGPPEGVARQLGLRDGEFEACGWVPVHQWLDAYSTLATAIAPLAESAFNRAKCLDAATRITTDRGAIPIAEVRPGDRVWRDGWRNVEAVTAEPRKDGLRLTLTSGRQLDLSVQHRLMVNGDWTRAVDIAVGDSVTLSPEPIAVTDYVTAPWPSDGRASRRDGADEQSFTAATDGPRVTVNERWGRLLGLFAGDGCAYRTKVSFSLDGQDVDLIDMVMTDLDAIGLWPVTDQVTTYGGEVLRRRFVAANSTHLIRFLRSLGVVEADHAKRVVTVPEVIWRSPEPVVRAFLAGIFEADGTATARSSSVSMTTKHQAFALDVQHLLGMVGVNAAVRRTRARATNGDNAWRHYWRVNLRRSEVDKFAERIGFLSARKQARLAEIVAKPHSNRYRPVKWSDTVESIDPVTIDPVDIQVEGEAFIARGIVSHNSWLKPLEAMAAGVPVICSPSPEYRRLVAQGAGVLAAKPKDWERALRRARSDEGWRAEQVEAGRAVAARWTYEAHGWRWAEVWEMAAAHRRKDLPRPA